MNTWHCRPAGRPERCGSSWSAVLVLRAVDRTVLVVVPVVLGRAQKLSTLGMIESPKVLADVGLAEMDGWRKGTPSCDSSLDAIEVGASYGCSAMIKLEARCISPDV